MRRFDDLGSSLSDPGHLLAGMSLTEGEVRGVAWVLREPAASLHGSIILREIGLPAVTNVRGATGAFRTGDRIVLRAGAGRVERANAGASSLV